MMTKKINLLTAVCVSILMALSLALAIISPLTAKADASVTNSQIMEMNIEDIAGEWTANSVKEGNANGDLSKTVGKANTHIGSIKVGKETAVNFKLELKGGLEYRIAMRHNGNETLNDGDLIILLKCVSDGEVQMQINRYNAEACSYYREGVAKSEVTMWIDANNTTQNFSMSVKDNLDGGSRINFNAVVNGVSTNHYVDIPKANTRMGEYISFFALSASGNAVATVRSMTDNAIAQPVPPVYTDLVSSVPASVTNQHLGSYNVGKNAEMSFDIDASQRKAHQYRVAMRHSGNNTLATGDLIMVVDAWGDGNVMLQINRFDAEACNFTDGATSSDKFGIDATQRIKISMKDNAGGCSIAIEAKVSGISKTFTCDIATANIRTGDYMSVFATNKASDVALNMGIKNIAKTDDVAKAFNIIAIANSNQIVVGESIQLKAVSKTATALVSPTFEIKTQNADFEATIDASGILTTTAKTSDIGKTFVVKVIAGEYTKDLTMMVAYTVTFEPKKEIFIGESLALVMKSMGVDVDNKDVVYAITKGNELATLTSGTLLGKGTGEVTLSATTVGITKLANVSITNPLTISIQNGKLGVGETSDLKYAINQLSNAKGTIAYEILSGNEFATLSGATLTGVKSGTIVVKGSLTTADYGVIESKVTINIVKETYNSLYMDSKNVYHEVGVVSNSYNGKGMIFEFDLLDFTNSTHSSEMCFVVGADGNDVTSMFDGGAISKFSNVSAVSFYFPDPAVRSEKAVMRYWPNVSEIVGAGGRDNIPQFLSYGKDGVATSAPLNAYDIPVPVADDWSINRTYRIEFNFDGSFALKTKEIGATDYNLVVATAEGSKWVADSVEASTFENVYSGIIMRRQNNESVSACIDNLKMQLPVQATGSEKLIGSYVSGESSGLDYSLDGFPTSTYVSGRANKLYIQADNDGLEIAKGDTVTLSYFIPDNRQLDVTYEIVSGDCATISGNVLTATKSGTIKVKAVAGAYESDTITIEVMAEAPAPSKGCGGCASTIFGSTSGIIGGIITLIVAGAGMCLIIKRNKKNNK